MTLITAAVSPIILFIPLYLQSLLVYLLLLLVSFLATRDAPLKKLSLQSKFPLLQTLAQGAALALCSLALTFLLTLLLSPLGLDDSHKVTTVIASLSIISIIIAVTLGPLAEEVFFRGLLQNRIGILLSSVLFALLHYAYGSLVELAGAFIISILLGYWSKKTGTIQPAIIAHSLYNLASILIVIT